MNPFTVTHRDAASRARAGVLRTPHGDIETPVFMPVGTQASVKTMGAHEIAEMGFRILLSNTYHLFLRPGLETLKETGGLHRFMAWPGAILTDSGGYQVFSLASRCRMSETGVEFSSHVDGERRSLTPESATRFQLEIGADIAMCLDECPPYPSLRSDAETSLDLTLRWAERCRRAYDGWLGETGGLEKTPRPLLFGIAQGAGFPELRRASAERTASIGFPGYAVGGLGVGEPKALTWELLEASLAPMPDEAPHYLMGFGQPTDFWEAVERGVDMFDCVLPTRNGRNGQAFTSRGKLNVFNTRFRTDMSPLDADCACVTCRGYTRAYLCHLFRAGELLAPRLVTLHNLWFMLSLLRIIRKSIINGNFREEKELFYSRYEPDDVAVR